ncbi:MAG: VacB and RNase family 3-5 exoribonuclease [Fibrobacteres bacterium]|nr:VacB and RNase family 3-5 exoribonuclease [Fibrobacterota bacterium]
MVRRVKGRKFKAEEDKGPAAPKGKVKKARKEPGKGRRMNGPAEEIIDIPLDEGTAILFDSDKELGTGADRKAGGQSGRKDEGRVPRENGNAFGNGNGAARSAGPSRGDTGRKGGGSKFLPRGPKGGFRDKGARPGRDDRNDRGSRDGSRGRRDEKFSGNGNGNGSRPFKGGAAGAHTGDGQGTPGDKELIKGKLIRQGGFHFVVPAAAGRGRPFEENMVLIPRRNLGAAKPGDIVSARITDDDHGERIGRIIATLQEEIPFSEVSKHFFKEYAVPIGYPKRALEEAASYPEPVIENYPDRQDFRTTHIITIDPSTAKDHDDAISLKRKKDGSWLLGVHIADVAEYVTSDTSLDNEAVERAFTQYLPWTAAPMLPQRLSSDLCSLLEARERLAFSCMMEVSPEGELKHFDFVESFIRVEKFYSYEEAQTAREAGDAFLAELDDFTKVLLAKRRKDGFIDFQFPEPKVELENGIPVRIYPGKRLASHSWIEECMLLANQATAKFLTKHKLPGLFRVHEQPDLDVVSDLWTSQGLVNKDKGMAEAFKDLDQSRGNLNPAIQNFFIRLLSQDRGVLPAAVQRKILQSMKKAQYSPEASGHFALGWLYYAHFTSPIRRYADLWTHRVIKAHVRGEKVAKNMKALAKDVAERISEKEVAIMKVERKGMKTATAWVLRKHIGEEFIGEVSGLENFGIFVSISDPFGEGLIPIRSMRDDYYEKDETTGHLVGKRTRQRFELGDKLKVRLDRSDPFTSQVDFDFLGRP